MNFSVDWFSHNIPVWDRILAPLKGSQLSGIEIGVFEGRSTLWLMENVFFNDYSHLVCIDTFEGSMEHSKDQITNLEERFVDNLKFYVDKLEVIKGKSQEVLRSTAFLCGEYDFAYVDGSHRACDVLEDIVLTFRLLKPGGILICDDYQWIEYRNTINHPAPGIDAFLVLFEGQYKLLEQGYQVIVQKL